jgi:hypothetical protein
MRALFLLLGLLLLLLLLLLPVDSVAVCEDKNGQILVVPRGGEGGIPTACMLAYMYTSVYVYLGMYVCM